ncbi:MAG TPA: MFS transporter [Candidatus Acidoferrales bacterium]
MSYLTGAPPRATEGWEEEYGRIITHALAMLSHRQRMAILLSVGLVTGVEISSRLSINVLLPDMQGNVAGSPDSISWVVILYNLGFLCSLALSYWMTRRLGARNHLLLCLGLYATGALGCACSPHNLTLLLISRVIMGFGGGAFLARTVILAGLMFPGKARIQAVTWLYLELFIFQISYPATMGWIADHLNWNYAFLLDLPFLAIGAFLIAKYVPPGYLFVRTEESYVDAWGVGLLVAALASMQIALSRGERDEWFQSPFIVSFIVIAVVGFAIFLWWDWRPENPSPVLHLRTIWKERPLRASLGIVTIVGAMLGAGLYVLPQYLRHVQDFSSAQTGGFVSAFTGGLAIGLVLSLRSVMPRIGGARTVALGATMMCATCVTFIYVWTPTTPSWLLAICTGLQGFSLAPLLLGAANIATSQAALADMNDVSTSFFFVRQLGNTFGVTAATVMFDFRMTFHSSRMLDIANRLDPTLQSALAQYSNLILRNGGAGSDPSLGALQIFQNTVIVQSQVLAFIDIYFGLAVLSVAILCLLGLSGIKKQAANFNLHFHIW